MSDYKGLSTVWYTVGIESRVAAHGFSGEITSRNCFSAPNYPSRAPRALLAHESLGW